MENSYFKNEIEIKYKVSAEVIGRYCDKTPVFSEWEILSFSPGWETLSKELDFGKAFSDSYSKLHGEEALRKIRCGDTIVLEGSMGINSPDLYF